MRRLAFESLEDRRLLSADGFPDLPGLTLVDPSTDARGQIIYLDFDGAEDVIYNGPVTVGPFDVPAFEAPGELAGQEEAIIASVVEQLDATFAGSGLSFTTESPHEGVEFSTVYIGGDDSAFREYGGFRGLAETIDIGNRNNDDGAFVFADELGPFDSILAASNSLGSVIGHEAGHLLGMRHRETRDAVSIEDYATSITQKNGVYSYTSEPNQFGLDDEAYDAWSRAYTWATVTGLPKNEAIHATANLAAIKFENPQDHSATIYVRFHRGDYGDFVDKSLEDKYSWAGSSGNVIEIWEDVVNGISNESHSSPGFSEQIWKAVNYSSNNEIAFSFYVLSVQGIFLPIQDDSWLMKYYVSIFQDTYKAPTLTDEPDQGPSDDVVLEWENLSLPGVMRYHLIVKKDADIIIDTRTTDYMIRGRKEDLTLNVDLMIGQ